MWWSSGARLVVVLVLLGGPVACGFHLRGEAHYSFDTLFLNSPSSQPLTMELKRSLEASARLNSSRRRTKPR